MHVSYYNSFLPFGFDFYCFYSRKNKSCSILYGRKRLEILFRRIVVLISIVINVFIRNKIFNKFSLVYINFFVKKTEIGALLTHVQHSTDYVFIEIQFILLVFKILFIDFANYSFNILADDQKQTAVRTLKHKTETEQQTQQENSQHRERVAERERESE